MSDEQQRPYSEQYRLAGLRWADLDGAARMLDECKTAVLAQRKADLGDIPDSRAETKVKASPEWRHYLKEMVDAKTKANRARIIMEEIRMKSMEQTNYEANVRHEFRITR